MYINEDLTVYRAQLFSTVRKMQRRKLFSLCWTYNGNIKVKTNPGVIKPIANIDDIKALCPGVDITQYLPNND